MSRELLCGAFLAAGAGAVGLLGGVSFVPGSSSVARPRAPLPAQTVAAPSQGTYASVGACTAAASVGAACALVAGAAVKSRRRKESRVQAAAKVLTTDSSGRFRFVTAPVPFEPSAQPGVSAPLGYFDPLGFIKKPLMTFPNDPTGFKHMREAELKNGRFAMLATVGSVYAHYYKIPGFEDVPTGLAALGTEKGAVGFFALFCCIGLFEIDNWKDKEVPGSYGDPFNFGDFSDEMRTKELNNCRLGMFAYLGQAVAELQTGLDPVQQLGL